MLNHERLNIKQKKEKAISVRERSFCVSTEPVDYQSHWWPMRW